MANNYGSRGDLFGISANDVATELKGLRDAAAATAAQEKALTADLAQFGVKFADCAESHQKGARRKH